MALKVERVMDGSVHIEKALGRAACSNPVSVTLPLQGRQRRDYDKSNTGPRKRREGGDDQDRPLPTCRGRRSLAIRGRNSNEIGRRIGSRRHPLAHTRLCGERRRAEEKFVEFRKSRLGRGVSPIDQKPIAMAAPGPVSIMHLALTISSVSSRSAVAAHEPPRQRQRCCVMEHSDRPAARSRPSTMPRMQSDDFAAALFFRYGEPVFSLLTGSGAISGNRKWHTLLASTCSTLSGANYAAAASCSMSSRRFSTC